MRQPPIRPATEPAPVSSAVTYNWPARLAAFGATHVITLTAIVMVVISAAYSVLRTA